MITPTTILRVLATCLAVSCAAAAMDNETRAKLDALTGSWRGVFEAYAQDGRLSARLDVTQTYRWEGEVQVARFVEVDRQGNRVTADARNFVDDDGRLVCEVVKSNGERSRHVGRIEGEAIVWRRDDAQALETFVERVEGEGSQAVYEIAGFGGYGEAGRRDFFVFRGRYARVETDAGGAVRRQPRSVMICSEISHRPSSRKADAAPGREP